MKNKGAARALMLSALVLSARAKADDAHYANFILGERAAGMGGAFTAIANDPSATYYNPAGLISASSDVLSANLSVYGFQQQSLQNALHEPSSNLFNNVQNSVGAAFQQLNTVPGMAGSVYGTKDKDDQGRFRQVFAISIMVPDATSASALNYVVDQNGNLESLSQTTLDQTALVGLGYALRLSDTLGIGVSLNGLYRSLTQASRAITALNAAAGPSTQFFEDDITLKLTVLGIYAQAGAIWEPIGPLTLGLTIASPSMTLFSNASTDEVQASQAGLSETYLQGLSGDTRWPVHGRAGAAYKLFHDQLLLSFDFSLWGYTSYNLVNDSSAGGRLPNFVNSIQREVTWNVNAGAQYALFGKYLARVGFFTNRSSAPGIDSGPEPQQDNVDLYGVTLGVTLPGRLTETTIGTTFSFGSGQSKTPTASTSQSVLTYATGPSNQLYFDVFLGGSHNF